jgi:hypothetical protein
MAKLIGIIYHTKLKVAETGRGNRKWNTLVWRPRHVAVQDERAIFFHSNSQIYRFTGCDM